MTSGGKRKRVVRPRTVNFVKFPRDVRAAILRDPTPPDPFRPKSRCECLHGVRPCPWVGCKWNLYLDVHPSTGSIKLNFPDLEPWEMGESCALDVAELGGLPLEGVGDLMNMTRERIRQVEEIACRKLDREAKKRGLDLRPDRQVQRGSGVEQEGEAAE